MFGGAPATGFGAAAAAPAGGAAPFAFGAPAASAPAAGGLFGAPKAAAPVFGAPAAAAPAFGAAATAPGFAPAVGVFGAFGGAAAPSAAAGGLFGGRGAAPVANQRFAGTDAESIVHQVEQAQQKTDYAYQRDIMGADSEVTDRDDWTQIVRYRYPGPLERHTEEQGRRNSGCAPNDQARFRKVFYNKLHTQQSAEYKLSDRKKLKRREYYNLTTLTHREHEMAFGAGSRHLRGANAAPGGYGTDSALEGFHPAHVIGYRELERRAEEYRQMMTSTPHAADPKPRVEKKKLDTAVLDLLQHVIPNEVVQANRKIENEKSNLRSYRAHMCQLEEQLVELYKEIGNLQSSESRTGSRGHRGINAQTPFNAGEEELEQYLRSTKQELEHPQHPISALASVGARLQSLQGGRGGVGLGERPTTMREADVRQVAEVLRIQRQGLEFLKQTLEQDMRTMHVLNGMAREGLQTRDLQYLDKAVRVSVEEVQRHEQQVWNLQSLGQGLNFGVPQDSFR